MTLGQLIDRLKKYGENEAGRLVQDLFLFSTKA